MPAAASFPLATLVAVPGSHWNGGLCVDLMAPSGTPWLAVFDGICRAADYKDGGHTVTITAADGVQAYYAHGRADGRPNAAVRAGQIVGYTSTSGNARATPPHLHFAVGRIGSDGAGTIAPWTWLAGVTPRPIASPPGVLAALPKGAAPWLLIGGALLLALMLMDD